MRHTICLLSVCELVVASHPPVCMSVAGQRDVEDATFPRIHAKIACGIEP